MNLPSLRQLQYLRAVIELRHFGKAAERCFVTQSTLSSGIQELENILGVQLLERSKRHVVPTLLGEAVAAKAEKIIQLSEEMVEMTHTPDQPLARALRLGVIPTIGPYLLPWVLPTIRQQFPLLELRLVEDQSAHLIQQLEAGTLDVAIIAFPYPLNKLKLSHTIFWQENFCVALPTQHHLAQQTCITTQNLPKDELLLLEEGHCLTDHALSVCKMDDLKISSTFQGTSLYTLLQMVAGRQGVTFVPEMAIHTGQLNIQDICLVPLQEPAPHREIGLVWRKSFYRQEDLYLLAQYMQNCMQQG